MSEHLQEATENGGIDPSFIRGMTERRFSRRQALTATGGTFASGLFLAACGSSKTTNNSGKSVLGSSEWWKSQKLHHTLNFANWPYYIDVLAGKHPSLEHLTKTTGIKVNYFEV
ncbi:MAG: hypothetical protein ACYC1I_06735, partial [Acidimicrobiales bacterium]